MSAPLQENYLTLFIVLPDTKKIRITITDLATADDILNILHWTYKKLTRPQRENLDVLTDCMILNKNTTLRHYGIKPGTTLHLVDYKNRAADDVYYARGCQIALEDLKNDKRNMSRKKTMKHLRFLEYEDDFMKRHAPQLQLPDTVVPLKPPEKPSCQPLPMMWK